MVAKSGDRAAGDEAGRPEGAGPDGAGPDGAAWPDEARPGEAGLGEAGLGGAERPEGAGRPNGAGLGGTGLGGAGLDEGRLGRTKLDEAGLGAQVRSTVGRLYRRFRSERPAGTLGDAALEVLTRLHKHGPQTLTQLSDHGHVAPASMSQSVNRLTSAGYAIRTPDPHDRRKVLFSTTSEGAELALAARRQRNAWLDAQLQALSPEDQAAIARTCELLSNIAAS